MGRRGRGRNVRLLLDTHVLLWALLEPERLSTNAAQSLEDRENEIWISPISLWECLILAEKGRVTLKPNPEKWVRGMMRSLLPREAPITSEVAIRSRTVEIEHGDPADRFLAATAAVFDLTLLTADNLLLAGKGYPVLSAGD